MILETLFQRFNTRQLFLPFGYSSVVSCLRWDRSGRVSWLSHYHVFSLSRSSFHVIVLPAAALPGLRFGRWVGGGMAGGGKEAACTGEPPTSASPEFPGASSRHTNHPQPPAQTRLPWRQWLGRMQACRTRLPRPDPRPYTRIPVLPAGILSPHAPPPPH